MQIGHIIFLLRLNKQNIGVNSPAPNGGQEKYIKYVSFPSPSLEGPFQFLMLVFFIKTFSEMELIKTKKIAISAES